MPASQTPSPGKPSGPLVLVADDVASARLLYSTVLIAQGYRVIEARDGIEALDRIKQDSPDLAILDISMPRMDGMQVLGALRRSGNKTPVLVITAHKDRETVLAAAQKGVVSYLTKPINLADFRERVRKNLQEHGHLDPKTPPPGSAPSVGVETSAPGAVPELDADTLSWLASAPAEGWSLSRLDDFLQAGEDLGAVVAAIAQAADSVVPHDPTRAERVAQHPPGLALAKLQIAFERGDEQVRLTVIDLLPPGLSEEQRVQTLARWVAAPEFRVRAKVVGALAALRSLTAVGAVLPLLHDSRAEVRDRVLEFIEAFGWLKALGLLLDNQVATGEEIPAIALERLQAQPPSHAMDRLRVMLKDGDTGLRAAVVQLAARLGWPEARRLIENALSDPEAPVRVVALEELCKSHDRRGLSLLFDLVTDPDPVVQKALGKAIVNAPLKLETRRVALRALFLKAESRGLFPELLAMIEEGEQDLPALLLAQIRAGDEGRQRLAALSAALGFKEPLPAGPVGPVVAKAFADHLAELLLKGDGGGGR